MSNEAALQEMLTSKRLTFSDYLSKYAANLNNIAVIEREDMDVDLVDHYEDMRMWEMPANSKDANFPSAIANVGHKAPYVPMSSLKAP